MSLLKVENISSGYDKKEVISDISFELKKAQVATIIGSNGAGKSTVLKTIYGINDIWGIGKITYEDKDISFSNPQELLKKGIVYIGQKNNTFSSLTVDENLKTAGYIYKKSILKNEIIRVYDLLPKLKDINLKKPHELSGGQRQLVALAMGLLHKPKLILFDEPSAGLDIKNMNEIFSIIQNMKHQNSISFLIVEHRVKEIAKITDRWIGLKLGEKIHDALTVSECNLRDIFL